MTIYLNVRVPCPIDVYIGLAVASSVTDVFTTMSKVLARFYFDEFIYVTIIPCTPRRVERKKITSIPIRRTFYVRNIVHVYIHVQYVVHARTNAKPL